MKKNMLYYFQIIFLIFCLMGNGVFFKNELVLKQYFLIILYIEVLLFSFIGGFFNLYQIFLVMLLIFNLGRIFLGVFYPEIDFRVLAFLKREYLNNNEAKEVLDVLILFIIGTNITFLGSQFFKKRKVILIKNKISKLMKKLFYLLLPFVSIKFFITIFYILKYGYIELYSGKLDKMFNLKGTANVIECLYIFLIYNSHSKKEYLKYTYLYIFFVLIPSIFTGQRGPGIVMILYSLYLYNELYGIKNKRKIFYGVFGITFLIHFIGIYRSGKEIFITQIFDDFFKKLLYSQSVSLEVVNNLIKYKEQLVLENNIPYIFYYFSSTLDRIKNIFLRREFSLYERLEEYNYLGDKLTYFLSKEFYLAGGGTGSAIIAEIYDLANSNLYFFFFYSILIFSFVFFLEKKKFDNLFWFYVAFYLLKGVFIAPRGNFLSEITKMLLNVIFIYGIYFFNSKFLKRKG